MCRSSAAVPESPGEALKHFDVRIGEAEPDDSIVLLR
jgi:hypothetical protein